MPCSSFLSGPCITMSVSEFVVNAYSDEVFRVCLLLAKPNMEGGTYWAKRHGGGLHLKLKL